MFSRLFQKNKDWNEAMALATARDMTFSRLFQKNKDWNPFIFLNGLIPILFSRLFQKNKDWNSYPVDSRICAFLFSRLFQKNKDWNQDPWQFSRLFQKSFHASSRKTRIETLYPIPWSLCHRRFHASSRKTRIETWARLGGTWRGGLFSRLFQKNKDWNLTIRQTLPPVQGVFTPLPEKQGLKLLA